MIETANPAAGTAMVWHTGTDITHLIEVDQIPYGDNGMVLCGRSTRFMDVEGISVYGLNLTLGHPGHCPECWYHVAHGLR
jgi:hypothetical protein